MRTEPRLVRGSVVAPDADAIAWACARLAEGDLVGMPTETVYGLGADATNAEAVTRLYAAKARPRFNPLIVHVPGMREAQRHVHWSDAAEALAGAFWPGPLTLVAPRAPVMPAFSVCALASAGLDTLAIRAPDHRDAQALLRAFDRPLVAPSANRSGHLSPTRAQDVARDLGLRVALILDGGPCRLGVESTVVACLPDRLPTLLRAGALAREAIEAIVGPLNIATKAEGAGPADQPLSPGQLLRHYAPARAHLRLNVQVPRAEDAYLGFGPAGYCTLNLSPSGQLEEAAARLFAYLRALDEAGFAQIAVAPIPAHGLGEAINDRLARAAAATRPLDQG